MNDYCQLSAFQRDVLSAIATIEPPADSKAVKLRAAEIREEPPTPYAYQVLDQLTDDDWLTRRTDQSDKRVELYRLTDQSKAALADRFDLLAETVCESVDQSPPDKPLRSDGGHPTTALEATLSVLHETDTTTVSTESTAEIRCRVDHGQLRLEAAGQTNHTTEAVLAADPQTMTALADRLYAIAAQAARGGPTDD